MRMLQLLSLMLASVVCVACGGGDDSANQSTCYVEGKPMPSGSCK